MPSVTTTRSVSHLSSILLVTALALTSLAGRAEAQAQAKQQIDELADGPQSPLRVIVQGSQESIRRLAEQYGIAVKRQLSHGSALEVTAEQLEQLQRDDSVAHISADSIVESSMAVATTSIGADQAWEGLRAVGSVTGAGIGIAVLDSGVASHPDLANRVVVSVDFVEPGGDGDDEYGHGTHVAGIAAGRANGGSGSGVAPGAHLINLRVLNEEGWGHASTVIEAIDWAIQYKDQYSIRVLNLSLGTGLSESYRDDPLGQAVERAVASGLVVVCSAGNFGKTEDDVPVIGGITSPGNTPSALTVGAINTRGTTARSDDDVTTYSSRGPTAYDYVLKPDLVAPGNKVVSLEAPYSYLSTNYPERQVPGGYFELSGPSAVIANRLVLPTGLWYRARHEPSPRFATDARAPRDAGTLASSRHHGAARGVAEPHRVARR